MRDNEEKEREKYDANRPVVIGSTMANSILGKNKVVYEV